jgi:hypothetical protein
MKQATDGPTCGCAIAPISKRHSCVRLERDYHRGDAVHAGLVRKQ